MAGVGHRLVDRLEQLTESFGADNGGILHPPVIGNDDAVNAAFRCKYHLIHCIVAK